MSPRHLTILSFGCALLAFPAFVIGGRVGRHIGYDASAETAIVSSATAGLLALAFGIVAAARGGRRLALLAVIAGLVVIGLAIWVANELIETAA